MLSCFLYNAQWPRSRQGIGEPWCIEILAEVFTRPPLTAYRRQPNIRNYLIRAKLPKKITEDEKKKLSK